MAATSKLIGGAATVAFLGILGYGLWRAWENLIVAPYRTMVAYNHGKIDDPLEDVLSAPVRSDEGFICPGTMVYDVPGVEDSATKRPLKVKVIEKRNEEFLGVKIFNGVSTIDSLPEIRIHSKDFRKALPCPASAGQP